MKEKSVKIKKTESLLRETLAEAVATLSDPRISGLTVVEVECSGGKSDATLFLDPAFLSAEEQTEALRQLRIAAHTLEEYVMGATGWFRSPKLHFAFDDSVEKAKRLDALFEQIKAKS